MKTSVLNVDRGPHGPVFLVDTMKKFLKKFLKEAKAKTEQLPSKIGDVHFTFLFCWIPRNNQFVKFVW